MEKKYIIPASTLFAGIIVWVIFLVTYTKGEMTFIAEAAAGIIIGGLFIFSAIRCRLVDGPKGGNIFRFSLLFVIAILSYWLLGTATAILLLFASIIILSIALKSGKPSKIAEI
jgi:hypothetical protein